MKNALFFPFLFLIASFALPSIGATAETLSIPQVNLSNLDAADEYGKEFVEKYLQEHPKRDFTIVLLHAGEDLPDQLKWFILHLHEKNIPFTIQQITESEMNASLEEVNEESAELKDLRYNQTPKENSETDEKRKSFKERVRFAVRQFFGMPSGVTWVWGIRDSETIRADFFTANKAALGVFLQIVVPYGFNTYFSGNPADLAVLENWMPSLRASAGLSVWVWMNLFWHQNINANMARAVTVKKVSKYRLADYKKDIENRDWTALKEKLNAKEWRVVPRTSFYWLTNYTRNFVTLMGIGYLFTLSFDFQSFMKALWVSTYTFPGYLWVHEMITGLQRRVDPATKQEIPEQGTYEGKTLGRWRMAWEFAYNIPKNMALLDFNYASAISNVFIWAYNVAGSIYTINWDRVRSISKSLVSNIERHETSRECRTLLKSVPRRSEVETL